MGSGDRIKLMQTEAFGIGVNVSRFPFSVTFSIHVALWVLSIGFGRGYDDARNHD